MDLPDHSVDRVISTYFLDLLSETDIRNFFNEAYRVLAGEGKLCLVSLTNGTVPFSRFGITVWRMVYRFRATLVGGYRPIRLERFIGAANWEYDKLYPVYLCPSSNQPA